MVEISAEELARLRAIERHVWHLFDNSENNGQWLAIMLNDPDYIKLDELLPEDHPDQDGDGPRQYGSIIEMGSPRMVPTPPAQPMEAPTGDGYLQIVRQGSVRNLFSQIGSNDHTPITRPFTEDSPKFYFTLGQHNYAVRYVEEPDADKGGCVAGFKVAPRDGSQRTFGIGMGYFDILNCAPGSMQVGELHTYDIDDDHHDDHVEALKDAIAPALRHAFRDMGGELSFIVFGNPGDNKDGGTTVFVYED